MTNTSIYQRGISLMELLLSLAIISALVIVSTRYYFQAENNRALNHTVSEIASLVVALQAWDKGNSDFTDLTPEEGILKLYNAGFLTQSNDLVFSEDEHQAITGAILNNAWGNPIIVNGQVGTATISTLTSTEAQCQALVSNFPQAQCRGDSNTNFLYDLSE